MCSNNSHGNGTSRAWEFMALCATLTMWVGLMVSPAEAAPFAYVVHRIWPDELADLGRVAFL
jgi:hypothetical protein